jgi:hypothetical protein
MRAVIRKKRCTFMIEPEVLERLESVTARTGLSKSEQIRQGIRWWLESREWPLKAEPAATVPVEDARARRSARRPRSRLRRG